MALAEGGGKKISQVQSFDEYLAQQYPGGYGPAPAPAPTAAPNSESQPASVPAPPPDQGYVNSLNTVSQYNQDNVYSTGQTDSQEAWNPQPYDVAWTPTENQVALAQDTEYGYTREYEDAQRRAPFRVVGNTLLSDMYFDQRFNNGQSFIPAAIAANPTLLPTNATVFLEGTGERDLERFSPVGQRYGNAQRNEDPYVAKYYIKRTDIPAVSVPYMKNNQPSFEYLLDLAKGLFGAGGNAQFSIDGPGSIEAIAPSAFNSGPTYGVWGEYWGTDPWSGTEHVGPLADDQRPGMGFIADAGQQESVTQFVSSELDRAPSPSPQILVTDPLPGYIPLEQTAEYEAQLYQYLQNGNELYRPAIEELVNSNRPLIWRDFWNAWLRQQYANDASEQFAENYLDPWNSNTGMP